MWQHCMARNVVPCSVVCVRLTIGRWNKYGFHLWLISLKTDKFLIMKEKRIAVALILIACATAIVTVPLHFGGNKINGIIIKQKQICIK